MMKLIMARWKWVIEGLRTSVQSPLVPYKLCIDPDAVYLTSLFMAKLPTHTRRTQEEIRDISEAHVGWIMEVFPMTRPKEDIAALSIWFIYLDYLYHNFSQEALPELCASLYEAAAILCPRSRPRFRIRSFRSTVVWPRFAVPPLRSSSTITYAFREQLQDLLPSTVTRGIFIAIRDVMEALRELAFLPSWRVQYPEDELHLRTRLSAFGPCFQVLKQQVLQTNPSPARKAALARLECLAKRISGIQDLELGLINILAEMYCDTTLTTVEDTQTSNYFTYLEYLQHQHKEAVQQVQNLCQHQAWCLDDADSKLDSIQRDYANQVSMLAGTYLSAQLKRASWFTKG